MLSSSVCAAVGRYWLVDCDSVLRDVSLFAHHVFARLLHVSFSARFAVFARLSRLRVFCVTDDRLDKTLERQQNYRQVALSQHVEVTPTTCRLSFSVQ